MKHVVKRGECFNGLIGLRWMPIVSYWELLPLEIEEYILKLRDEMYRDDHRVGFRRVLSNIVFIGRIMTYVGLFHVKIHSLLRKKGRKKTKSELFRDPRHDFFCGADIAKRTVSGCFKDGNGMSREIFLGDCLCEIDDHALQEAMNKRVTNWRSFRFTLFWDEWRNLRMAANYFVASDLARAREEYKANMLMY